MNTSIDSASKVARVAVTVRLYFDVPTDSTDEQAIRQAALAALEQAADLERIRVKELRFPVVYPVDDWPALTPADFAICDISPSCEANRSTRFAL